VAEAGPFAPGTYRVSLRNNVGQPAELSQSVEVVSASVEKRELSADPAFMRKLAEISGGASVGANDVARLPEVVRRWEAARQLAHRQQPVWDRWWVLAGMLDSARPRMVAAAARRTCYDMRHVLRTPCPPRRLARVANRSRLDRSRGAAALALVLADAAMDLSEGLRLATPWLLGAGAVVALGVAIARWYALNDRRVARLFERAEPALGDRLTNAVQLSSQPSADSVQEFLRREAVELGRGPRRA
jgi:hypothetical protein